MRKIAFMSIDVESYLDTRCLVDADYAPPDCPQCEQSVEDFAQLLNKYSVKGTFFVVGSFLDRCEARLKNAVADGHEIALHGLRHVSPLTLSYGQFVEETAAAKREVEERLGTKIIGYRAPCFGINDSIVNALQGLGFKYDSSNLDFSLAIKSGNIDLSDYKKLNGVAYKKGGFYEFSPCSSTYFRKPIPVSGGGYLRLLPFVSRSFNRYVKNTDAYLFYVHPFEIYKGKLPYPKSLAFYDKLYIKCRRQDYLERIEKLIKTLIADGFEFMTFKEFVEQDNL
ncbi:MAG: polysaccharide deacetylase family protein [Candidatus Coproplasma sp.]